MRKRKKSIWRYRQNLLIISKLIVIKHGDDIFILLFCISEHRCHFSSYAAPTNFPSLAFLVIMLSFLLLFLVLDQCTNCKVTDLSFSAISCSFFNSLFQVPRKQCCFQSALSLYWRPLSSEEMTQSGFWPLPLFLTEVLPTFTAFMYLSKSMPFTRHQRLVLTPSFREVWAFLTYFSQSTNCFSNFEERTHFHYSSCW